MVDNIARTAVIEQDARPLSGEERIPPVVSQRGEYHGVVCRAVHHQPPVAPHQQHGVVGEVELLTGLEREGEGRVDSRCIEEDMRPRVIPIVTVNHVHPAARRRAVIHRVAAPCRYRQPLPVAEHDGVADNERKRVYGVVAQIGLDEDKDTVAGHNLHIARHHRRIAVHIEAERALPPVGQSDAADDHIAVAAVVDLHLSRGAADGSEEGVESHRVDRELKLHLVLTHIVLLLARKREPRRHRQQ